MIKRFSVKNFRGFSEKIEIDFSHHANYEFHDFALKDGIIKNGIFYGQNGCGKTNFSMAMFDIVYHLTSNKMPKLYFKNYANAANLMAPVEFEYEFVLGRYVINYRYTKTVDKHGNSRLWTEQLTVNNEPIFDILHGGVVFYTKEFKFTEDEKNRILASANKVSILSYILSKVPLQQDHYLIKLRDFVDSMKWLKPLKDFSPREYSTPLGGDEAVNIYEYLAQNNLVNEFSEFLFKVSNQKFNFRKEPKWNELFGEDLVCMFGENAIPLSLIASTGTHSLTLLFYWLKEFMNASFIFIDEFDAFYHFKLSKAVCDVVFHYFDCQVFLTSHNTLLMTNDLLRPDCNFIISNNKVKSVVDCTQKELRFGHNIEKLYRGEAFGL